jgi:HK97 family phage prohead protease
MTPEHKAAPVYIKSIKGREVTGIFAVMGNLDDYADIGWPGMFLKTFQERKGKIVHLWQHHMQAPPIAIIKSLRELGRSELPKQVLAAAPEATGAAEVTREYLETGRADEVFKNIKAGAPLQMSYAYDAVGFDFTERGGVTVRNLREVRLYETSDVLWGANDATVAAKHIHAYPHAHQPSQAELRAATRRRSQQLAAYRSQQIEQATERAWEQYQTMRRFLLGNNH